MVLGSGGRVPELSRDRWDGCAGRGSFPGSVPREFGRFGIFFFPKRQPTVCPDFLPKQADILPERCPPCVLHPGPTAGQRAGGPAKRMSQSLDELTGWFPRVFHAQRVRFRRSVCVVPGPIQGSPPALIPTFSMLFGDGYLFSFFFVPGGFWWA